jgi:hypothetical protein
MAYYMVQDATGVSTTSVYGAKPGTVRPWRTVGVAEAANEARYQAARRSAQARGPLYVVDADNPALPPCFVAHPDGREAWLINA